LPRIFDNIEQSLLPALRETLAVSHRADFCAGYFNLRGWRAIDDLIAAWPGTDGRRCRVLVGMQKLPEDEIKTVYGLPDSEPPLDNASAVRLKRKLAEEFRTQLTYGLPTAQDEAGLRRLAAQLLAGQVQVRLHLAYSLHAKLYLLFRNDPNNPTTAFLGSSNLTMAGLAKQGELNVDVLDHDATIKLAKWFDDRWADRWCLDISKELAEIIEQSWARSVPVPPYHVYLKMAWHLSHEARLGLAEYRLPRPFDTILLDFQQAAVKIAARHVTRRGGVLLGDVVGLGKTLMATALARMLEDDFAWETLILCPKNLVPMWETYRERYGLRGKVMSLSQAQKELPKLKRYRLLLLDESHNLRNPEGRRWKAIRDYVAENEARVILVSATPFNKAYVDLSSQFRLFVPDDKHLGIRPETLIRSLGIAEFRRKHQCEPHTLKAFEHSPYIEDWRELMRLYMVRRTRSFIQQHYAHDDGTGRKYLELATGKRSYFPDRVPKTVTFPVDESNESDVYARLYAVGVVTAVASLRLPRYGLGNFINPKPGIAPTSAEQRLLDDLSRAGKRLMGFCRTNLFKRLESSGFAFLQSLERHLIRNQLYLHAIERGLDIPIGTLDAGALDDSHDEDWDWDVDGEAVAEAAYEEYAAKYKTRFKWVRSNLFSAELAEALTADMQRIRAILELAGHWDAARDTKLAALHTLVAKTHKKEKVLVFTQFADTARYLDRELKGRGLTHCEAVTAASNDPARSARRFSPSSNDERVSSEDELRVLIATDVLSEGQNLQDAAVVVNYDLPWAIIRLIQRAGRVDRIGQTADKVLCYTFLPSDGIERLIQLRARIKDRLKANAEVVGTDEQFFEDEEKSKLLDLYHEKAGVLDGEADSEVDLASIAYQIWKDAKEKNPELETMIEALPNVVYSTKRVPQPPTDDNSAHNPDGGALVYVRTGGDYDALAWVGPDGEPVTESQFVILRTAACAPDEPALEARDDHHALVARGTELIAHQEHKSAGGQLGRPSSPRAKTYERLKRYAETLRGTLFDRVDLHKAVDELYQRPLTAESQETLGRQLKAGLDDDTLAELVVALREDGKLCVAAGDVERREPQIICSLGLAP
jgi:superfamily II DNA or RNA helicase